jgi:hypothetical protein
MCSKVQDFVSELENLEMQSEIFQSLVSFFTPERRLAPRAQPHLAILGPEGPELSLAFTVHLVADLPVLEKLVSTNTLTTGVPKFGQERFAPPGYFGTSLPPAMQPVCLSRCLPLYNSFSEVKLSFDVSLFD